MKGLSKEQFLGIVRHVLTFVGGFLVMQGVLDEGMAVELSGAVVTLAGGIWSILDKHKTELK
jgi:hypothetical protein